VGGTGGDGGSEALDGGRIVVANPIQREHRRDPQRLDRLGQDVVPHAEIRAQLAERSEVICTHARQHTRRAELEFRSVEDHSAITLNFCAQARHTVYRSSEPSP
jgi:hypothetical protein